MELRNGRVRTVERAPPIGGPSAPPTISGERLFASQAGAVEQMLCLDHVHEVPGADPLRFWREASVFDDSAARLISHRCGQVQWQSTAAEKLLSRSGCLRMVEGRLTGSTRQVQLQLEGLLAEASKAGHKAEALLAPAEGERATLFVRARCAASDPETVLLLLRGITGEIGHFPDLVRLYGLTQSEHQIVCMLMNGISISEIAGQQNNSVLTVRTHLKRTYAKLGICTKEQLFAKLIRLMAD